MYETDLGETVWSYFS